ncbi:MAG: hypothetical protein RL281_1327, partial [Pseudomonadota bacterium]
FIGRFQIFEQFIKRMHLGDGFNLGNNALVTVAARQFDEAFAIGFDQFHAHIGRFGDELAHARIAAAGVVVDLDDGFRGGFEAHIDGMEAEEYF